MFTLLLNIFAIKLNNFFLVSCVQSLYISKKI